jgi:RNA polymerase sigma-70 factor (ECF subfamily)
LPLSQAEFCRFVDEHGPALYRTAYRMVGDVHEAEDIVQETFRSVWRSRLGYRRGESERAWLISILRRRVADRWRKRRLPAVLPIEAVGDVATLPDDYFKSEYTDQMQQALSRLPSELRETLLLVVVGELTHQQAADELGVAIGTVLSRVSRARERLREYYLELERQQQANDRAAAASACKSPVPT